MGGNMLLPCNDIMKRNIKMTSHCSSIVAVILLAMMGPSNQQGQQFYFTNAQQPRFLPSFSSPQQQQFPDYYNRASQAQPPVFGRAPSAEDLHTSDAPPRIPYQFPGFPQQSQSPQQPSSFRFPSNEPSPFNSNYQPVSSAHFNSFPSGNNPARVTPRPVDVRPTFATQTERPFGQQFYDFQPQTQRTNSDRLHHFADFQPIPSVPAQASRQRAQTFDQITISPLGYSGAATSRDPTNLRLIQNFRRPPGLEDQRRLRPPTGGFPIQSDSQGSQAFRNNFSTHDDTSGSTLVDQNLEVDDNTTDNSKAKQGTQLSSTTVRTRDQQRKADASLRRKPGTRPQPGSKGNFLSSQNSRPGVDETEINTKSRDVEAESPSPPKFRNKIRPPAPTTKEPSRFHSRFNPTTYKPTNIRLGRPTKNPFNALRTSPTTSTESDRYVISEEEEDASAAKSESDSNQSHSDELDPAEEYVENSSTSYEDQNVPVSSKSSQSTKAPIEVSTTAVSVEEEESVTDAVSDFKDDKHETHHHLANDSEAVDESSWALDQSDNDSDNPSDFELHSTEELKNAGVHTNNSHTFEVLTMNPGHSLVEDENFKGFVDSVHIDATETPQKSHEDKVSLNTTDEEQLVSSTTPSSEQTLSTPSVQGDHLSSPDDPNMANPTESWVIVASVQTSRSVSGARFLPSSAVKQEERPQSLSGKAANELEDGTDEKTSDMNPESSLDASLIDETPAEQVPIGNVSLISQNTSESLSAGNLKVPIPIRNVSTVGTSNQASTESIIDKLDRVQSELSSGILTGFRGGAQLEVLTEMSDKPSEAIETTTEVTTTTSTYKSPVFIRKFTPHKPTPRSRTPSSPKKISALLANIQEDDLTGLLPPGFKPRFGSGRRTTTSSPSEDSDQKELPQGDEADKSKGVASGRSSGLTNKNAIKTQDISALLPPGYKLPVQETTTADVPVGIESLLGKIKFNELTVPGLLPPGFVPEKEESIPKKGSTLDISALLPPGYVPEKEETEKSKPIPVDISALLPVGYKPAEATSSSKTQKAAPVDISALLPPGYVPGKEDQDANSKQSIKTSSDDISSILPPGFKLSESPTEKKTEVKVPSVLNKAKPLDVSAFLPPGFKLSDMPSDEGVKEAQNTSSSVEVETTTHAAGYKVVFPSRPGGKKPLTRITTTEKTLEAQGPPQPKINKGWPIRATTLFTGWPTVPTTTISMERLLEIARTSTTTTTTTTTSTSKPTTTTTTTTARPTTPGVCGSECDLAATVKLVSGVTWVPELLDHNTKEWQELANQVEHHLEGVYSNSIELSQWFKKIRIDSFSEGSVLVDYFVEFNDVVENVDTQEIKKLFHESIMQTTSDNIPTGNETSDETMKLGIFGVDPSFTDFIVLQRQIYPTVGYAEEDLFLPQWAIAGIVIGLASLLFVIIFGVIVLVNRHKNNHKRHPTPLTEDMLNELNKNHMGGLENYGAEDLYNMEDVWNDKPYDKPPKKRSSASLQENSMSNLYDSWRSEWNGHYYNAYYGNGNSSNGGGGGSTSGYARRRSDYDTNF